MENSKYKSLENKRIKEVAKEYLEKGYEIFIEPNPKNLPDFLKNYRPDILAIKGNEKIVIEVKSSMSINKSKYLIELANRIENNEGWKFELVITNPKKKKIERNIPSLDIIQDKLNSIYQLNNENQIDAAFILSWATFEAATRKLLSIEQPNSKPELVPNALIKQLYSFGIIGRMDYNHLNNISKKRNEIVHGFFDENKTETKEYSQRLTTIIKDLIKEIEVKTEHNNV